MVVECSEDGAFGPASGQASYGLAKTAFLTKLVHVRAERGEHVRAREEDRVVQLRDARRPRARLVAVGAAEAELEGLGHRDVPPLARRPAAAAAAAAAAALGVAEGAAGALADEDVRVEADGAARLVRARHLGEAEALVEEQLGRRPPEQRGMGGGKWNVGGNRQRRGGAGGCVCVCVCVCVTARRWAGRGEARR